MQQGTEHHHGVLTRSGWTAVVAFVALVALVLALADPAASAAEGTPKASPAADTGGLLLQLEPLPEGDPRPDGPLRVAVTMGIVADLVRQVGGQRVAVTNILPANADPHDFEPAPRDVVAIEDAEAVITYGLHLDEWAEDLVANSGTDAPVFVVTEGVQTLTSDDEEFEEGDPHAWFDPTRVQTMVANIARGLTEVDPGGAATYDARAEAYQGQLAALDTAIKERVATLPVERRKLVTNHDALSYFADRYGFEVVGTVIPSLDTRAEVSARDVAGLVELIDREGVPAIFAENTSSPGLAQELATQAGVAIIDDLYTDSLGEPGSGAETYIGLMQTDTVLIVEALR